MHPSVDIWIGEMVDRLNLSQCSVIEFGSLDVNGSVRHWFKGPYLGIDKQDGRGVDYVVDSDEPFKLRWQDYSVIVSTEMLEHCRRPAVQLVNMYEEGVPGAHLLLTCRGFDEVRGSFPFHPHPEDNWRFSMQALVTLCEDAGWQQVSVTPDPDWPGWFVHAVKR